MLAPTGRSEPHVYISLTTISSRLEVVHATIESLLDQRHENVSIFLHVSREAYLLDAGVNKLPSRVTRLLADSRFRIRFVPNMGPYRKLLPILAWLGDRSALVATVDDDTRYPDDWLSTLLAFHARYRCVIAKRGHPIACRGESILPYREWMNTPIVRNPDILLMPTGKDGILYDSAYFPPSALNYHIARVIAPTADDIWFRWHTAMCNVPVFCISTDYRQQTLDTTVDGPETLFNMFNNGGGNDAALERVHRWAKESRAFDILASQSDGGHYRIS